MSYKKGFSLVEILVVTIIIGILVTTGTIYYNSMIQQAQTNTAETNLEILFQGQKNYWLSHEDYCRQGNGCGESLNTLNTGLGLNLVDNAYAYACWWIAVSPNRLYCTVYHFDDVNMCTNKNSNPNNAACEPSGITEAAGSYYPRLILDVNNAPQITCNDNGTGYCPQNPNNCSSGTPPCHSAT